MYTLEIETKTKVKKVDYPRKARLKDCIFFDLIQVMDTHGKWHTICHTFAEPGWKTNDAVWDINKAIKRKNSHVLINL